MKPKIKVVVFDDNKIRRMGLDLMINSSDNMECLASFNDCRNVVDHIAKLQPDVVLMGYRYAQCKRHRRFEINKSKFSKN